MPTCHPSLISPILCEINQRNPRNILDVGIGTGKWGSLIREYLDVWYRKTPTLGNLEPGTVILDGIEIHRAYETPLWKLYNTIFVGDASGLISQMSWHDLILCVEVLEHMRKEEGLKFILQSLERCSFLIISYTNEPQGVAFNNEHEAHVSQWSQDDLRQVCPDVQSLISIRGGVTEAFCLASQSRRAKIDPGSPPVTPNLFEHGIFSLLGNP